MCDFEDGFEDDGFMDDGAFDDGLSGEDDPFQNDGPDEAEPDEPCGPDWQDIAFLGALSEELAEERRRREQLRREMDHDTDP